MKIWKRIPYAWRLAFILWLGMRLLLWALSGVLSANGLLPLTDSHYYTLQPINDGWLGWLFGAWLRWDGVYYDVIVQQGYHALPQLSAFFPLYPLLARPLFWMGMHPLVALVLVGNLAFLLALILILEEVELLLGREYLLATGLAVVVFPTSFYFYAPYPHSLALLLILIAWRWARQGQWLACALAGLALGLTHSSVIPLVVVLFIQAVRSLQTAPAKLGWARLAVPFMPLAGVAGFLAWRVAQGFPPFGEVQYQFWQTEFLGPLEVLRQFVYQMFHGRELAWFALVFLAASILALVWLIRRKLTMESAYMTSLILFLLCVTMPNVPLGSFSRLIIIGFPIYFVMAAWMKRSRWAYRLILTFSGVLYFIMCFAYLSWMWVA